MFIRWGQALAYTCSQRARKFFTKNFLILGLFGLRTLSSSMCMRELGRDVINF
jgi:hypothetical protein